VATRTTIDSAPPLGSGDAYMNPPAPDDVCGPAACSSGTLLGLEISIDTSAAARKMFCSVTVTQASHVTTQYASCVIILLAQMEGGTAGSINVQRTPQRRSRGTSTRLTRDEIASCSWRFIVEPPSPQSHLEMRYFIGAAFCRTPRPAKP
jgi:hypothetical protein